MADETGLTWVKEPTIGDDGTIVYSYRNTADADATFVIEMVNIMPEGATNQIQSFQLDGLAVGAEQETHAPGGSDLPDGKATVHVSIQSASGTEHYDGEIEYQLACVVTGGVLRAAGDATERPAATIAVTVLDMHLDGEEVVVHYRVTGTASIDMMSFGLSLYDPQGQSGWMHSGGIESDREDIIRVAVPFDEVLGTDSGWTMNASLGAASSEQDVQAYVHAQLPVERVDDAVIAPSGFTIVETT